MECRRYLVLIDYPGNRNEMKYPLKTSLGIVHFNEELKSDKSRLFDKKSTNLE